MSPGLVLGLPQNTLTQSLFPYGAMGLLNGGWAQADVPGSGIWAFSTGWSLRTWWGVCGPRVRRQPLPGSEEFWERGTSFVWGQGLEGLRPLMEASGTGAHLASKEGDPEHAIVKKHSHRIWGLGDSDTHWSGDQQGFREVKSEA